MNLIMLIASKIFPRQKIQHRKKTQKKVVNVGSLGKYCVRFGSDVKQFCSNVCLEDHKKGLKVCCYCQKNISGMDGVFSPDWW